jgi:hypothetical protein
MRRLIIAALSTAALGLAAAPASAAPASGGTISPTRTAATPHCVVEPIAVGSTRTPAAPACFATFAESIAYATKGAVLLPKGATRVTQQQLDAGYAKQRAAARAAGVTPQVTVIIGISYHNTGFTGPSNTHPTSSDCDTNPDVDFFLNTLPAGLDNLWSSAQAFGQCQGTYYDLTFRPAGGARVSTNWTGGAMDNRTSSIDWV